MAETGFHQHLYVFAQFVWYQYIFERFPFLGDFQFAVVVTALIVVIIFDEVAVKQAVFCQDLLGDDQYAPRVEPLVDAPDQFLPVDGAHELQRKAKNNSRSIFDDTILMQIGILKRTEERRGGKEGVSPCKSRVSAKH